MTSIMPVKTITAHDNAMHNQGRHSMDAITDMLRIPLKKKKKKKRFDSGHKMDELDLKGSTNKWRG